MQRGWTAATMVAIRVGLHHTKWCRHHTSGAALIPSQLQKEKSPTQTITPSAQFPPIQLPWGQSAPCFPEVLAIDMVSTNARTTAIPGFSPIWSACRNWLGRASGCCCCYCCYCCYCDGSLGQVATDLLIACMHPCPEPRGGGLREYKVPCLHLHGQPPRSGLSKAPGSLLLLITMTFLALSASTITGCQFPLEWGITTPEPHVTTRGDKAEHRRQASGVTGKNCKIGELAESSTQ